jgi:hypothetical protein
MIDISKIKPGDKVTLVPLEVADVHWYNDNRGPGIRLRDSEGYSNFITADQIAAHHPAPREIGVGDRVKEKGRLIAGTVEHVARGAAWVLWDDKYETLVVTGFLILVERDHERS